MTTVRCGSFGRRHRSEDTATIDSRATELLPRSRLRHAHLRQLMMGELAVDDPLALDYDAMHLGKQVMHSQC